MKFLLDNRLAPLTFTWGFLESPVDNAVEAYVRWQKGILYSVRVEPIDQPLQTALEKLEPLDMESSTVLFLSTKSSWTACFDNGLKGGNTYTFVGYLCEALHCRGVLCRSIPNTLSKSTKGKRGTWGAVQFTLFSPVPTKFLNIERDISVMNDVSGWDFRISGTPQPFEDTGRYEARKKAERFTAEILEQYCRAIGIDPFNEAFYGGPGAIIRSHLRFGGSPKGTSLREAQMNMGLLQP